MVHILDLDMHEKIENLSSLTTLTIDIQNAQHALEYFQHQLSVSTESIVEICVQQHQSTSTNNPRQ